MRSLTGAALPLPPPLRAPRVLRKAVRDRGARLMAASWLWEEEPGRAGGAAGRAGSGAGGARRCGGGAVSGRKRYTCLRCEFGVSVSCVCAVSEEDRLASCIRGPSYL